VRYSAPEGMTDDCVCALGLSFYGLTMRPRICFGLDGLTTDKPSINQGETVFDAQQTFDPLGR